MKFIIYWMKKLTEINFINSTAALIAFSGLVLFEKENVHGLLLGGYAKQIGLDFVFCGIFYFLLANYIRIKKLPSDNEDELQDK